MPEGAPRHHLVVTIARTMGAGGSLVGRRLAERLQIRYLDREILVEAARRLKRDPEALESLDERHLSFWERTRLAYAGGAPEAPYLPPPIAVDDMDLFDTQKAIMREAAERGSAVVVGRASFAVLAGLPGHLSVFLHAPLADRVRRVQKIYRLGSLEEAREVVEQCDQDRERFVKAASGLAWRDLGNYHLCLDTSRLGTAGAVEILVQACREVERHLSRLS